MSEHEWTWQKAACYRCGVRHPWHCPDCWGEEPPCADHVCAWPDEEPNASTMNGSLTIKSGDDGKNPGRT